MSHTQPLPLCTRFAGVLLVLGASAACGGDEAKKDAGGDAIGDDLETQDGWYTFGADLSHTRTNPDETGITTANVDSLELAWRIDAPGVTSTPAVVDGVVYWADWGGNVYATNAEDGSERWRASVLDAVTSSLAVVGERVYVSDRAGSVHALDRDSGDSVWSTVLEDAAHVHLWSSPVVVGNLLIVGIAGRGTQQRGDLLPMSLPEQEMRDFRGAVVGVNIDDGSVRWRFETTIGPDGTEYGSGVSVWSSAAVDTGRKLAFIGTGNSYFADAGPYSDALIAIEYESGELAWATQFTSGDAFRYGGAGGPDYDVGAAPNLFVVGDVDAVGVGDKGGHYRALDRDTGELLEDWSLSPGASLGGGIMVPAAYHDGVLYVESNQSTQARVTALPVEGGPPLWEESQPDASWGAPALAAGVLYTTTSPGNELDVAFGGSSPSSMFAYDAPTGGLLWQTELPQMAGGGVTVAEGMVFVGHGFHYWDDASEPIEGGLSAYRPTRAASADGGTPPPSPTDLRYELLSETGLYSDTATTTLADGVRAFRPRFLLWSDTADKERWIFLPDGAQIDTSDMDLWSFPVGTKVWKQFVRDGVRAETRVIEKVSDSEFFFMAFQWNDDLSDAVAIPDGAQNVRGTEHDIPSQEDCEVCHDASPMRLLGPSAVQLSHDLGGVTLDTLVAEGLLTDPPAAPITPPGDATAQDALGYLHANCGFCHMPASPVFQKTNIDLSLPVAMLDSVAQTPAYSSNAGVPPEAGGAGTTTARLMPGDANGSTIIHRMKIRGDAAQMPPIGTELTDDAAIATISAWIDALPPQ